MEISYLLISISLFLIVFIFAELLKKKPFSKYQKVEYLLNNSELSFFKFLKERIPSKISIMCKVRLIDIVKPISTERMYISDKNKVISKHIDFVLINSETSEIRALIEVNGSSHMKYSRQNRDKFVENITNEVNLKLFTVEARKNYDIRDIQSILEYLEEKDMGVQGLEP